MFRIAVFAFAGLFVAGLAHAQQEATDPPPSKAPMGPMARPSAATPGGVKCLPTGQCGAVRIHFGFNSAELDDEAQAALANDASCLMVNKSLRVTIEGRTDERGSAEFNLALGQRRADAVANYLKSRGVPSDQLFAVSLGKSQPICAAHTETCWRENRNVAVHAGTPVASAERME